MRRRALGHKVARICSRALSLACFPTAFDNRFQYLEIRKISKSMAPRNTIAESQRGRSFPRRADESDVAAIAAALVSACKALDRIIRSGRSALVKVSHWLAYLDVFGRKLHNRDTRL